MTPHTCPRCHATFQFSSSAYWRAGRVLPCPGCGAQLIVTGAPWLLVADEALAETVAEYRAAYALEARLREPG